MTAACQDYEATMYGQYDACNDTSTRIVGEMFPFFSLQLVQKILLDVLRQQFVPQFNGAAAGQIGVPSNDIFLIFEDSIDVSTSMRFTFRGVSREMLDTESRLMIDSFTQGFGPIMLQATPPLNITDMRILMQQFSQIQAQPPNPTDDAVAFAAQHNAQTASPSSTSVPAATQTKESRGGGSGRRVAEYFEGDDKRFLQFSLFHLPPAGDDAVSAVESFDDVDVYISATCKGSSCSNSHLTNCLQNKGNMYAKNWILTLQEKQRDIGSDYFTSLLGIIIDSGMTDAPQTDDTILRRSSAAAVLISQPPPAGVPPWVQIMLGVDGILFALGLFGCLGGAYMRYHSVKQADRDHAQALKQRQRMAANTQHELQAQSQQLLAQQSPTPPNSNANMAAQIREQDAVEDEEERGIMSPMPEEYSSFNAQYAGRLAGSNRNVNPADSIYPDKPPPLEEYRPGQAYTGTDGLIYQLAPPPAPLAVAYQAPPGGSLIADEENGHSNIYYGTDSERGLQPLGAAPMPFDKQENYIQAPTFAEDDRKPAARRIVDDTRRSNYNNAQAADVDHFEDSDAETVPGSNVENGYHYNMFWAALHTNEAVDPDAETAPVSNVQNGSHYELGGAMENQYVQELPESAPADFSVAQAEHSPQPQSACTQPNASREHTAATTPPTSSPHVMGGNLLDID